MGLPEDTARFRERAASVQSVVIEVDKLAAAFEYAAELTSKLGGQSIAAPGITGENLSLLASICQKKNLMLLTENLREEVGRISTGLTLADWGISRTATLVIDSESEDIRIATMLSETHVAVLPKSRIVADIGDIEAELTRMMKAVPGYLSFISGASRTADIERVLTTGVHGPQELHIVIVEEGWR